MNVCLEWIPTVELTPTPGMINTVSIIFPPYQPTFTEYLLCKLPLGHRARVPPLTSKGVLTPVLLSLVTGILMSHYV